MNPFRYGVFHCTPFMSSGKLVIKMLCPSCGYSIEENAFLLSLSENQCKAIVPCTECGDHVELMRFDGATIRPPSSSRPERITNTSPPKQDF